MKVNFSEKPKRFTGLDGLRGIAALVVLLHHSLLVYPTLSAAYFSEEVTGPVSRWAVYSPLHIFWAGTEAVYVFFVLSGFVLVRMHRTKSFTLKAYYPSRLLRLYGPTIFAVLLGALFIWFTPTNSDLGSRWMTSRGGLYSFSQFISDFSLIFGISGHITPLWSLQWEVIFSLLLPAFVLLARPNWAVSIALLLISVGIGAVTQIWGLFYLPLFGFGVLIAAHWERIEKTLVNLLPSKSNRLVGWSVVCFSLLLIDSRWLVGAFGDTFVTRALAMPLVITGVCLLVILAGGWMPLSHFLQLRVVRWLGLISFSLYLVHEPVIVFFASWLGESVVATGLGIASSLLLAQVFYWLIEKPIHIYSQRLRKSLAKTT